MEWSHWPKPTQTPTQTKWVCNRFALMSASVSVSMQYKHLPTILYNPFFISVCVCVEQCEHSIMWLCQGNLILYLCTDDKHNKQALLDKPSIIHKWIVLDGSSSILWADNMNQLLSDVKVLSLANGQKITLKGKYNSHHLWTNSDPILDD